MVPCQRDHFAHRTPPASPARLANRHTFFATTQSRSLNGGVITALAWLQPSGERLPMWRSSAGELLLFPFLGKNHFMLVASKPCGGRGVQFGACKRGFP